MIGIHWGFESLRSRLWMSNSPAFLYLHAAANPSETTHSSSVYLIQNWCTWYEQKLPQDTVYVVTIITILPQISNAVIFKHSTSQVRIVLPPEPETGHRRRECDRPDPVSACPRSGIPIAQPASLFLQVYIPDPRLFCHTSRKRQCTCHRAKIQRTWLNLCVPGVVSAGSRNSTPYSNCLVIRARDYALAIRWEYNKPDWVCVSSDWFSHWLPQLCIHDPRSEFFP